MRSRTILEVVIAAVTAWTIVGLSPVSAASNAPLGYQLLCLKTPSECRGGGASIISGTTQVMGTLRRVNAQVNSSITPRADGAEDVWSVNVKYGDCEDFALTKRRALIGAGLPASALRIAYVKTRSGEGHAILVVKTNTGDLVLDNLSAAIRPLSQTGYSLVSMSSSNPTIWS